MTPCDEYRDAAGFCQIAPLGCMFGGRCPKTAEQAERMREQLVDEAIRERDRRTPGVCQLTHKPR